MSTIKTKLRAALEDVKITPNCEFGFIAVTCDDGFLAFWGLDVKDSKQARELCDEQLQVCKINGWEVKDPLCGIDFLAGLDEDTKPSHDWDSHVAILTLDQLKSMEQ